MLLLALTAVIFLAVLVGLVFSRTGSKRGSIEGLSVPQVLGATALLASFLLGAILAASSSSYSSASRASKTEADTIDTLYESAVYIDEPFRQRIQAAAGCYGRAIVGPEYRSLAHGETSPVPSNWTGTGPGGIRATLREMTPEATGFGLIQSADAQRGALRSERQTQANATVPAAMIWFLVVLIALSLGGLAYSLPAKDSTAHMIALGVVALTFVGAMALLYNLDRPFSGVLAQEPTAMAAVTADVEQDYLDDYKVDLPCDQDGVPLESAAGAPAASTTPPAAPATTVPAATPTAAP